MKLLDLFCGAGGAAMGYSRAGFEVVGVDINPQPHYPFEFIQADALEFVARYGKNFDVIHASPPCQAYSISAPLSNGDHPRLIEATRTALIATGKPYVIENVPGAPLLNPIVLCGTMFGLGVLRHRLFECEPTIWFPPTSCSHEGAVFPVFGGDQKRARATGKTYRYITVAGKSFIKEQAQLAMRIEWMTNKEMAQSIPPAYTEWIGKQILEAVCHSTK